MHATTKTLLGALAASALLAGVIPAQIPGAPVLQNAWAAPGIVAALNISGGSAAGASNAGVYALAAGWAPSGARFQLSGGGGAASGGGSRGVYGVRAAVPITELMQGKLGLGGFVGVGGSSAPAGDSISSTMVVPVGAAIGYRMAIGSAGRGFSAYVDPNYQLHSGPKTRTGFFRVGIGVDAGITSRLGATLGLETGSTAPAGKVGPRGSVFGLGVSMKMGR